MTGRTILAVAFAAVLAAVNGPAYAQASPVRSIVVLPAENVSGHGTAAAELAPLLLEQVSRRGWTVAAAEQVDHSLEQLRVRYLDSLEETVRIRLAEELQASAFLLTTVFTWHNGDGAAVAIAARLVDSAGRTTWGEVVALTAEDSTEWFGAGADAPLEVVRDRVIERLFRRFPEPGREPGVRPGRPVPVLRKGPPTFRSAALARGEVRRVCVLPFDNATRAAEASRVVSDLLALRMMARKEFDVVEPSAFRAALREEQIRSMRNLGPAELERLGRRLDTDVFIRGTVYAWRDPLGLSGAVPFLQMELSAVDAEQHRIVWNGNHTRSGDDYQGFLMRGSVTSAVGLSDRVVSELIDAQQKALLRRTPEQLLEAKGKVKHNEKSAQVAGGAAPGSVRNPAGATDRTARSGQR
jgi:hypothetical protein